MATTTLRPRPAAENATLPSPCLGQSFDNSSATGRSATRRRSIPFHVLADAFATVDEELTPEPDRADFPAW
jgi:hypothetical protein